MSLFGLLLLTVAIFPKMLLSQRGNYEIKKKIMFFILFL